MRQLPNRPSLSEEVELYLQQKTEEIKEANDKSGRAAVVYSSSRSAKWFRPITAALRQLAGPGERCMFCSGSECSQVEHFWPKERFPEKAMTWVNFLWVCALCNNYKGAKFPFLSDGSTLINPMDENVWDYFFIDRFGNLTEKWVVDISAPNPRAKATVLTLALDREALQISRRARLKELRELTENALQCLNAGLRSKEEVRASFEDWKLRPFQLDVADYFLVGPGCKEEPFKSLVALIV